MNSKLMIGLMALVVVLQLAMLWQGLRVAPQYKQFDIQNVTFNLGAAPTGRVLSVEEASAMEDGD